MRPRADARRPENRARFDGHWPIAVPTVKSLVAGTRALRWLEAKKRVRPHAWQACGLFEISVSSEESVGEVRFGKGSESVIERVFVGFLCTETVGFSGDQF